MNIKEQLIEAYNKDATRRDEADGKREEWKATVRKDFSDRLKNEKKKSVLELGAGAGFDSKFFQDEGFEVLATDLSPEMVKVCQKRDIPAQVGDIYNLSALKRSFDAVYSMNVLLHVPKNDLPIVLNSITQVLNPNGLFFYGVYGGHNKEDVITDNTKMGLPRFFSFFSDESLLNAVVNHFEVVDFQHIDIGSSRPSFHFQALTLRGLRSS